MLLLGELAPDSGTVRLGTNLQIAYFDQLREQLDPERTVAETISPGSDWVEIDGERKHVMTYLSDFLFPAAAREVAGEDALRRRAQPSAARAAVRAPGEFHRAG